MIKQKALHRDGKYSEQFEIKAEISAIIILYLEITPLSHLSSTISSENCYNKPANSREGTVMSVSQLFCPHCAGHHVTIAYDVIGHFTIPSIPQPMPQQ